MASQIYVQFRMGYKGCSTLHKGQILIGFEVLGLVFERRPKPPSGQSSTGFGDHPGKARFRSCTSVSLLLMWSFHSISMQLQMALQSPHKTTTLSTLTQAIMLATSGNNVRTTSPKVDLVETMAVRTTFTNGWYATYLTTSSAPDIALTSSTGTSTSGLPTEENPDEDCSFPSKPSLIPPNEGASLKDTTSDTGISDSVSDGSTSDPPTWHVRFTSNCECDTKEAANCINCALSSVLRICGWALKGDRIHRFLLAWNFIWVWAVSTGSTKRAEHTSVVANGLKQSHSMTKLKHPVTRVSVEMGAPFMCTVHVTLLQMSGKRILTTAATVDAMGTAAVRATFIAGCRAMNLTQPSCAGFLPRSLWSTSNVSTASQKTYPGMHAWNLTSKTASWNSATKSKLLVGNPWNMILKTSTLHLSLAASRAASVLIVQVTLPVNLITSPPSKAQQMGKRQAETPQSQEVHMWQYHTTYAHGLTMWGFRSAFLLHVARLWWSKLQVSRQRHHAQSSSNFSWHVWKTWYIPPWQRGWRDDWFSLSITKTGSLVKGDMEGSPSTSGSKETVGENTHVIFTWSLTTCHNLRSFGIRGVVTFINHRNQVTKMAKSPRKTGVKAESLMALSRIFWSVWITSHATGSIVIFPSRVCVLAIWIHAWTGLMAFPTWWYASLRFPEMTTLGENPKAARISHGSKNLNEPSSLYNMAWSPLAFKWSIGKRCCDPYWATTPTNFMSLVMIRALMTGFCMDQLILLAIHLGSKSLLFNMAKTSSPATRTDRSNLELGGCTASDALRHGPGRAAPTASADKEIRPAAVMSSESMYTEEWQKDANQRPLYNGSTRAQLCTPAHKNRIPSSAAVVNNFW